MHSPQEDYRRYLDPKVLAKIARLEVRARLIVEGYFAGMHRSPYRGLSAEFADHRTYSQGDDLRRIDWKVFGRTDKYYIKEYEHETNLSLVLVVDCSDSMGYRSNPALMTKHDYATSLAAAIAYLTLRQQDAVGLALFDSEITDFLRASNNTQQWRTIIQRLTAHPGRKKTQIGGVLNELADRLSQRSVIVLISDLFNDLADTVRGLKHLRYCHHELLVWNLWDPVELAFPFQGPTKFEGLEGDGHILVEPRSLRDRYLSEVNRFLRELQTACGRMQADLAVFDTATSLGQALSEHLAARTARLRRRSARVTARD